MSKVLVIELPDDADLNMALRAVNAAIGSVIRPAINDATAYGAIREDADRVLNVFRKVVATPDPQEGP